MVIAAPLLARTTMNRAADAPRPAFTARQGQFLAFIYTYTLVNGRPPAEADMMRFFRLTPPSVHQMILKLEQAGLISRQPGVPRSIVVLLDRSALPALEPCSAQPVKTSVQRSSRKLYVNSIAYNDVTYGSTTASPQSDGTATFAVGGNMPTTAGPADTLTLHLSEDAWNGNAQFVLTIDGKQISTAQDVTALHSADQWQDLTFTGNFGAGSHSVEVSFINDAWGGTASSDRNLYINGVDCNGLHAGGGVTSLYSNGKATFTIVTQH
jgi:hypothetical protein